MKNIIFNYLSNGDTSRDVIIKDQLDKVTTAVLKLAYYAVNNKENSGNVFLILGL